MNTLIWNENISSEIRHWDEVLKQLAKKSAEVRAPKKFDAGWYRTLVTPPSVGKAPFHVLDVGSGPISTLGIPYDSSGVSLTLTDALADSYNLLLRKYGLTEFPAIRLIKAEELSNVFDRNTFDWIACSNALDHCEDPARAIGEMIRVCRLGGVVSIVSIENEGLRQSYGGLHQWNLEAKDDGIWLWNASNRQNIIAPFLANGSFEWGYANHGQVGFNIFVSRFYKVADIE